MLDNLSFGEPQGVAPKKMERKVQQLPQPIANAYDKTPLGEARTLPITIADPEKRYMTGVRLVSLLKRYAKEHPASVATVPFKASFTLTDEGIVLYWQKKAARTKPVAIDPEAPDKPILAKPRKRGESWTRKTSA